MGRLFLSGGGDKKQTEKIDQYFVKQINSDKPLLYIPIAMKGAVPYGNCFEWIYSVLKPLGIQNITMWTDLNNKSLKDLDQFSAIYIGGGNTFSLLKDLRISGFDEILKKYIIENEGIVYGGSAGAIVLGANIMTCAHMDLNSVKLQDYTGISLIKDYSIWCHYQEKDDQLIKAYIKEYEKPVIALSEETGVLLCDEGLKVLGNQSSYVFENGTKKIFLPLAFI